MKSLGKSSLITVVFFVIWLLAAFSYSIQAECSCCSQKEYQCECSEKRHAGQLSFKSKGHHEDNHCSCIQCENFDAKETLSLKIYLTSLEKKQVLAFGQDISDETIPLPTENIATRLDNKSTLKFLSLFLLNSSFLL